MNQLARVALFLVISLPAGCGDSRPLETRTFDLEHLPADIAAEIIEPYVYADLAEAPGLVSVSHEARTLTVRERIDNLDRIAQVLRERDRPRPGVRLHFQVIEASPGEGSPDPAIVEVEGVLRDVFRFGGYRMVGETVVSATEGSEFSQNVAGPAASHIVGTVWTVQTGENGAVRARLSVELWLPSAPKALATTVNIADEEIIVLGTAGGPDDGAIILIVRPVFEQ